MSAVEAKRALISPEQTTHDPVAPEEIGPKQVGPEVEPGQVASIAVAPTGGPELAMSTAPAEPWRVIASGNDRWFAGALGVALAIHVLPVLFATGVLLLTPNGTAPPLGVGDPSGEPDGVNVETIDASEFQKQYISFDPGKDDATTKDAVSAPPPTAQPTPPRPEIQPTPPAPQLRPAQDAPTKVDTPEQEAASPEPVKPDAVDPAAPPEIVTLKVKPKRAEPSPSPKQPPVKPAEPTPPTPPTTLSAADIAEIMESTRLDAPSALRFMDKAGAARLGTVSEFSKAVYRKIGQVLPNLPGPNGRVYIGLIVSDSGEVAQIAILKGSRNPANDRVVVDRLRATRFIAPDRTVKQEERMITFTYDY